MKIALSLALASSFALSACRVTVHREYERVRGPYGYVEGFSYDEGVNVDSAPILPESRHEYFRDPGQLKRFIYELELEHDEVSKLGISIPGLSDHQISGTFPIETLKLPKSDKVVILVGVWAKSKDAVEKHFNHLPDREDGGYRWKLSRNGKNGTAIKSIWVYIARESKTKVNVNGNKYDASTSSMFASVDN